MRRNEARTRLDAAREWEAKGMFKPGAFTHIEKSLADIADEPSLAMQSFYAIGGVLLGAATAALYALLEINDLIGDAPTTAWLFFLIWAIVLLGAGLGTSMTAQKELGDALLLAGLVPTTILLGPTPPLHEALIATAAVLAFGVLALRREAYLLPVVSLALACVAVPVLIFRVLPWDLFGDNDVATWFWLLAALGIWGMMAIWNRVARPQWDDEGAAITTVALGIAWVMTVFEVFDIQTDGVSEIVIGLGLGALIGAGVLLKERGIIFTAGIGLTIDAIAFAFNVGGPTVGLITLLLLAGGLIAWATVLRRRKAQQTRSKATP